MTCVGFAIIGHYKGAARHVIGAFEIALVDAHSKSLDKPAWQLFWILQTQVSVLMGWRHL